MTDAPPTRRQSPVAPVVATLALGVVGLLLGGAVGLAVGLVAGAAAALWSPRAVALSAAALLVLAALATVLEAPLGGDINLFVADRPRAADLGRTAGIAAIAAVVGLAIGERHAASVSARVASMSRASVVATLRPWMAPATFALGVAGLTLVLVATTTGLRVVGIALLLLAAGGALTRWVQRVRSARPSPE